MVALILTVLVIVFVCYHLGVNNYIKSSSYSFRASLLVIAVTMFVVLTSGNRVVGGDAELSKIESYHNKLVLSNEVLFEENKKLKLRLETRCGERRAEWYTGQERTYKNPTLSTITYGRNGIELE